MRDEHHPSYSGQRSVLPSLPAHHCRRCSERGVALVITLLLLFLLSVVGLAAVLTTSSDVLINGYYRNYRGSFYAADSGATVAREVVYNYFNNASNLPAGTTWTSLPNASSWGASAQTTINSALSSYSLNSYGQATHSWPGSFTATVTIAAGTVTSYSTSYVYPYTYTITSVGKAQGSEAATIVEQGSIPVTLSEGSGTTQTTTSFAAFGAFIDSFSACSAPLVPGYLTGPMYAYGEWNFGSSGTYTFTDPVSQTDSKFSYWPSNGGCSQSSQPKYGSVVPSFQSGYNLSTSAIALPSNDFSQKEAVIDGLGTACSGVTTTCPTTAQMNAALKNISGTAWTSSTTSGVFLPYTCTSGVCALNYDSTSGSGAGGIYVEGGASVTLSTSGSYAQVIAVKQGSTTTTITINPNTGTTTVSNGTTTLTLSGVPHNYVTSSTQEAAMLYVDGAISSLSGPSSGAAIQDNSELTVVANGNITVTGNITYKTDPVTTSANQYVNSTCCTSSPIDTLIPAYQNMNQVLGIFTSTGNFILSPTTNGANIEVDASIAMISQAGVTNSNIGHMATGNSVGTFTNIGGRIENRAHSVSMNKSNVLFDRRFTARSGFAPPWFPSTSVAQDVISSTIAALPGAGTPSRTFWLYTTGGQ